MIRVMLVDDSVVVRRLLKMILAKEPDIEVVYEARNGRDALDHIQEAKPDLLTLDVEMPILDGIATLKELRRLRLKLPVIMFSTLTNRGANTTLEALSLGASDYLTKPESVSGLNEALEVIGRELVPRIRALYRTAERRKARKSAAVLKKTSKESPPAMQSSFPPRDRMKSTVQHSLAERPNLSPTFKPVVARRPGVRPRVDLLVIGVSTGGPNALAEFLPHLPGTLPVPVLVVQHMPPLFTRMLADRLDDQCELKVREAQGGERIRPGEIWIAQGDWHMEVQRSAEGLTLRTHQGPQVNSCRPAVDPLFESAVRELGGNLLGVVLTGMGRDGALGSRRIREAGGSILVQDESSSVVWGMPGAVASDGFADEILPLENMATAVIRRVMHGQTVNRS